MKNRKSLLLGRITAPLVLTTWFVFALTHMAISDEVSILKFRGNVFIQQEGKKEERIQKKGPVRTGSLIKTGRDSEILLKCGQMYYALHAYSKAKIESAPSLLYGKLSQSTEPRFLIIRFFITPPPSQGKTLKVVLLSDSLLARIDAVIYDEYGHERALSFYSLGKNSYRALTGFDVEAKPEKYHLKITAVKKDMGTMEIAAVMEDTPANMAEMQKESGNEIGFQNKGWEGAENSAPRTTILYPFYLKKTPYESGKVFLPEKKGELLEPSEKKNKESRILWQVLKKASQDVLWEGAFGFPMQDPVIISTFGKRRIYYINRVFRFVRFHRGIDFEGERGEPILSPNNGVVVFSDKRITTGYTLVVDHGQGIFSLFFHLDSIDANEGDMVRKGDIIGSIGSTGIAAGPHLHWGLMVNGVYVDPSDWIERVF